MKKILLPSLLAFFLLVMIQPLRPQDSLIMKYAETIRATDLSDFVHTLASEAFQGRATGSEGQKLAAEYIRSEFKKAGLENPFRHEPQTYLQSFILDKCYWDEQALVSAGGLMVPLSDYVFLSDPMEVDTSFEVVYAGFGIDDSAYSDLSDLDVTGKVVLAFSGEPSDREGNYFISGSTERSRASYYYRKAHDVKEKGAAGLIIASRSDKDFKKYVKKAPDLMAQPDIGYPGSEVTTPFFTLFVTPEEAAGVLGLKNSGLKKLLHEIEGTRHTNAGRYSGKIDVSTTMECYPMNTENVIGYIEGSDRKREAVVVVAHYDHHGIKEGVMYPGADDNASGTAAVMELAKAFSKAASEGHPPSRSIIFLAVAGEEIGLHGSHYYTDHPFIPLAQTYACVNIDMIGRVGTKYGDDPNYIAGWAYLSPEILEMAKEGAGLEAPEFAFKMSFRNNASGGSDQYYFARNGIPALFYFTGIHKDYHSPGDTADKILYPRMEEIVRSIFATVWKLANNEESWLDEKEDE